MSGYVFVSNGGIPQAALEQTETWYSKDGTEHKIEDMAMRHAKACMKFVVKWHGLAARNTPLYRALEIQSQRGPLWVRLQREQQEQQAAEENEAAF